MSKILKSLFVVIALVFVQTVLAGVETNTDENGVAIHGYDPVAYFAAGEPTEGSAEYSTTHNGVTYHFASAENKAAFEENPEKYLPQYGGYCAFGTAKGKKFDVDPTAWEVVDDKLYLNLNHEVRRRWSEDIPGYIDKADTQWRDIKEKDPADLNKS